MFAITIFFHVRLKGMKYIYIKQEYGKREIWIISNLLQETVSSFLTC